MARLTARQEVQGRNHVEDLAESKRSLLTKGLVNKTELRTLDHEI